MACVVKRRGKWVLDFRDQTGTRRWETYETRREADAALAKRIGEVKGRSYRAPADLPTFATVAAAWLDGRRDRATATIELYAKQVTNHLLPAFGPLRIDQVTSEAVERFRNEKRNSGLKPGTVNVLMQRMASILRYAIKHQYVTRNAADSGVVERVRRQRVAERRAQAIDVTDVLTADQARALIEASEAGLHRTFITTALLSGCRSGELLALTWGHVDLEARKLRISRSLSWDRTGEESKPVFGPPKTDSSYRTLDIVPELAAILAEWKLRSRFAADTDLVFTNQIGGAIHLSYLQRGARRAFARCSDVPVINLHGLRHTFASILLLQRRPVTQVAKLLGHKDPSITISVYSHWFDDAEEKNREAMADLAAAMLSGSGSKTVAAAGA